MSTRTSIISVVLLLLASGCSNTRFLADDQLLYTGREKVEIIQEEEGSKSAAVKRYTKSVTSHKVNNALLGRRLLPPIGLWVHNYWKVDEQKKFGSWLYKSLSSDPVLITDVNPELRSKKIESELFDLGYFQTRAWAVVDTSVRNQKKAGVSYFVEVAPPSHYDQILFDTLTETIDTLISQDYFTNQIKTGDQFNLAKLETARNELSRRIQDHGYFYFIPDFIELSADTSAAANKLNLIVGRKKELPQSVLSMYEIDKIIVQISQSSDTVLSDADTVRYMGVTIISSGDFLKPDLIGNAVFFNQGDLYSYAAYQRTLTRLNSLGVFSYVRISFEQSAADSLLHLLNVRIDAVMSEHISVDLETDLVTKSTGYFGPALSVGISHGNAFKGAEKIHVALNGGLEWQWGKKSESQLGTLSYDFGIGSGLTFPEIILPGNQHKIRDMMIQETSMNLDFDIINRTAYYKMFSTMTHLNYRWGKSRKIQHSYSPFYVNSVSLIETTPAFDSVVDENIYIRKSFEEQFIVGMKYEFSYDNTFKTKPHNFFFQAGINSSGNVIDLFKGMGKEASERPYYFLNNIYSQHVKITTDLRYYLNGLDKTLVFRLYAGVGMPYGNSTVLPYVEQFFSGGAYSIRGFTARYLGPGSYNEDRSGYIDQSGDMKLEGNLEYRFGISKIVKGAIFLETGNIWLANEDENRPGAKFDFHTFYNQLAVGSGIGLRFDFNLFVLRTDLGFPLRTPYMTDEKHWLFGTKQILSGKLFYLAIGYPF
ncbi:MAG: BamA/TamA family outer membrane protein [Bacteroidota bacterium]